MVEDCRTYKDESVEERSWNEETNCQVWILTVGVDGCMMNTLTKAEVDGEKDQDMYTALTPELERCKPRGQSTHPSQRDLPTFVVHNQFQRGQVGR